MVPRFPLVRATWRCKELLTFSFPPKHRACRVQKPFWLHILPTSLINKGNETALISCFNEVRLRGRGQTHVCCPSCSAIQKQIQDIIRLSFNKCKTYTRYFRTFYNFTINNNYTHKPTITSNTHDSHTCWLMSTSEGKGNKNTWRPVATSFPTGEGGSAVELTHAHLWPHLFLRNAKSCMCECTCVSVCHFQGFRLKVLVVVSYLCVRLIGLHTKTGCVCVRWWFDILFVQTVHMRFQPGRASDMAGPKSQMSMNISQQFHTNVQFMSTRLTKSHTHQWGTTLLL